jgi:Mrp family chromosome partitioning ATPase
MQELLNLLREEYSIILIDAPPVLKYVDSDVLSEHSNGVILVVRSRVDQLKDLTQTIKRIEESGGAILGAILTDVNPIFLSMKI